MATAASSERISVAVRVRPLTHVEKGREQASVWRINAGHSIAQSHSRSAKVAYDASGRAAGPIQETAVSAYSFSATPYVFDHVLGPDATTAELYERTCQDLVVRSVQGYNASIFAYGQTGSGKTYTMQGTDCDHGVVELAVQDLFREIAATSEREFLLRVSYFEVYNEQVNDLLNAKARNLKVHVDPSRRVFVADIKQVVVKSVSELLAVLDRGQTLRSVGSTAVNADSSRSHSVVRVSIESSAKDGCVTTPDHTAGQETRPRRSSVSSASRTPRRGDTVRVSCLYLVDLAGSERMAHTRAQGLRRQEGIAINKSLSALGNVVRALSEGKAGGHVPYRDSKLTMLLQEALNGSSNTAVLCCATPAAYAADETHMTLKFATRAKRVQTRAVVHESSDETALLARYKREIEKLQLRLTQMQQQHQQHQQRASPRATARIEAALQRISASILSSESVPKHHTPLRRHRSVPSFDHRCSLSRPAYSPKAAQQVQWSPKHRDLDTPAVTAGAAASAAAAQRARDIAAMREQSQQLQASLRAMRASRPTLREQFKQRLARLEIPTLGYVVELPDDDVLDMAELEVMDAKEARQLRESAKCLSARIVELEDSADELARLLQARQEDEETDSAKLASAQRTIAHLVDALHSYHQEDGELDTESVSPRTADVKALRQRIAELSHDNEQLLRESNTYGEASLLHERNAERLTEENKALRAERDLLQQRAAELAAENLATSAIIAEASRAAPVKIIEEQHEEIMLLRAQLQQMRNKEADRRTADVAALQESVVSRCIRDAVDAVVAKANRASVGTQTMCAAGSSVAEAIVSSLVQQALLTAAINHVTATTSQVDRLVASRAHHAALGSTSSSSLASRSTASSSTSSMASQVSLSSSGLIGCVDLPSQFASAAAQTPARITVTTETQTSMPSISIACQSGPITVASVAMQAATDQANAAMQTVFAKQCSSVQTTTCDKAEGQSQTCSVATSSAMSQTPSPAVASIQTDAAVMADVMSQTPASPSVRVQTDKADRCDAVAQTWLPDTDPADWEHVDQDDVVAVDSDKDDDDDDADKENNVPAPAPLAPSSKGMWSWVGY